MPPPGPGKREKGPSTFPMANSSCLDLHASPDPDPSRLVLSCSCSCPLSLTLSLSLSCCLSLHRFPLPHARTTLPKVRSTQSLTHTHPRSLTTHHPRPTPLAYHYYHHHFTPYLPYIRMYVRQYSVPYLTFPALSCPRYLTLDLTSSSFFLLPLHTYRHLSSFPVYSPS